MIPLLIVVSYLVALVSASTEHSCHQNSPPTPDIHCIHNLVLTSSEPHYIRQQFPPSAPALYLNNCTVDHLPADALSNATEHLWILGGSAPSVHLSPSLKTFTSLRAGTREVVIDPVDNYRLEVFDMEGGAREVPENVHKLRALKVFDVCQNGFEEVNFDTFQNMTQLWKINLGWNRIWAVTINNVHLPALKELFLHGNLLTSLNLTGLTAPNLQHLYVSSNLLKSIGGLPTSVSKFPNLVRLDLYGNPWHCDWLGLLKSSFKGQSVEMLSYLPKKVCDESGTVAVQELQCMRWTNLASKNKVKT